MKSSFKWTAAVLAIAIGAVLFTGCGKNDQPAGETAEKASAAQTTTDTSNLSATSQSSATPSDMNTASPGGTRVVIDSTGAEITVPEHPKNIVVSPTVLTNMIFFMMETTDTQLAITKAALTGYENSIMKDLAPDFGDRVNTTMINQDLQVDLEELAKSDADLVLYWDRQADEAAQVNALGIPAFCLHSATDMDSLRELITMLGDVLNCKDRANELLAWYDEVDQYMAAKKEAVDVLSEDQKPKTIQFQRLKELKIYYKGVDTKLIQAAGGQNIALEGASAEQSTPTMEEILQYNPDIIFLSNWDDVTPQNLYDNTIEGQDWSHVEAVMNRRVYKVPIGLYRWTPPNCTEKPLYALYLASMLQPDVFSEVDMRGEIKAFFERFFDYKLSDEQVDRVMHTDMNAVSR